MDPQQFQLFLTELNKVNSNLQTMQALIVDQNKDTKKPKTEEKLNSKEKSRILEISKIYSKEFKVKFDDINKKQEEIQKKQETFLKKNGITVKIESVSRDVLRSLKRVFSESVGRSLSMQAAPGGKKPGMAGAAGDFLGNLIGGAGIWGVLIAAIAAVGGVAVIFLLLKNLDKISAFMKDALPAVGDFLVKVLPPAIESAGKAISTVILPLLKTLVDNVVKLADTILSHIPPVLKAIGDILLPIIDDVKEFLMFIIKNIPTIVESFFGGISKLTEIILTNLPPIMPFLTQIASYIKEIGLSLIDKIPVILKTFKDVFLPTLSAIKDIILALIPPIKDIITTIISGIERIAPYVKDILVSAFTNLKEIFVKLFDSIQPLMPYIGPVFLATLDLVKTTITGIFNAFSTLVDYLKSVALKILDSIDKIFKSFSDNFKWIITQDPTHILKVAGAVTALGAAMATFGLAKAGGELFSAAGSFFNKVAGGKTPIDSIIDLADRSDKILVTADNIKILSSTLAEITNEKYGDGFVEEMKKVSHGLALITNVKNLDKLQNLNNLKGLDGAISEVAAEPIKIKQVEVQPPQQTNEENSVFQDLYVSTDNLNQSILSLKSSLDEISGKLNDSLRVQQQQAQLTDSSISTLREIRDKEQSSSNVVVNNSTNSMVFSQKSTSNTDYRKDLVSTVFS